MMTEGWQVSLSGRFRMAVLPCTVSAACMIRGTSRGPTAPEWRESNLVYHR